MTVKRSSNFVCILLPVAGRNEVGTSFYDNNTPQNAMQKTFYLLLGHRTEIKQTHKFLLRTRHKTLNITS